MNIFRSRQCLKNYTFETCCSLFSLSYRKSVALVFRLSLSYITLDITASEDPNAAEVVKISTGVSQRTVRSECLMKEP